MGKYEEVQGDLIELAKSGKFDAIAHGCNCFCTQRKGIAAQMVKEFSTDEFPMERDDLKGDMRKLGNIDYRPIGYASILPFFVVNCYTQYRWANMDGDGNMKPLNYAALELCLIKLNSTFKGKRVGLPQIGCNLAGGDWPTVKEMIKTHLKDCDVTVVIYKQ